MPSKKATDQSSSAPSPSPSLSPSPGCVGGLCVICKDGFPSELEIVLNKDNHKSGPNTNILFHLIADGLNSLGKREGLRVKDISSFTISHYDQLRVSDLFPSIIFSAKSLHYKIKDYLSKYSGWIFDCIKKDTYIPKMIISVYQTNAEFYSRRGRRFKPEIEVTDTIETCTTTPIDGIPEDTIPIDMTSIDITSTSTNTTLTSTSTDPSTTTSSNTDTSTDFDTSTDSNPLSVLESLALEEAKQRLPIIMFEDLESTEKKLLGKGGWGEIWRYRFGGQHVAVKKVATEVIGKKESEDALLKEAALINRVRSRNVVNIFGIATNESNDLHVVLELANQGDLERFIKKNSQELEKEWPLLLSLFQDICFGIKCLHSIVPPIVHRDLKPGNILLKKEDRHYIAMIADLGISKAIFQPAETVRDTGPYLAPEVEKKGYGLPSDIYSLGVIGIMLFYPGWRPSRIRKGVVVLPTLHDSETESRKRFFEVIQKCLNPNPALRPTANDLFKDINQIKEDQTGKPWNKILMPKK